MVTDMDHDDSADLKVLTTVNAPYRREIDGATLARSLVSGPDSAWLVHVATFFTDVRPGLVLDFADRHAVARSRLAGTYVAVRDATGESNAALEAALGLMAGIEIGDARRRGLDAQDQPRR